MKTLLFLNIYVISILIFFCLTGSIQANFESIKNGNGLEAPWTSSNNEVSNLNVGNEAAGNLPYHISMEEYEELSKIDKRSPMFTRPRVGRSYPSSSDAQRSSRRVHTPFNMPRTGRSDPELRRYAKLMALERLLEKRTGPSATSGMWFGPRLGKRDSDTSDELQRGQPEDY